MAETVYRTCTLCEAMCGLAFEVDDGRILRVRPDEEDVFSRGYACPKGIAFAELHDDPDRLRRPLVRTTRGTFDEIGWEEALDLAAERLQAIRDAHGPDAVAAYYGNPTAHQHGATLMVYPFLKTLGTRNRMNANSQDANPRLAVSYYLYGASWVIPVPDLERTRFFLCVGANPLASNGSILTAPDMRGRLRAIRARGGRVVVVDPRRTETVREADEHVAVRPGGDAALLLGMLTVLHEHGRLAPPEDASGWESVVWLLGKVSVAWAATASGVPAETIARLAEAFATAEGAACYTRTGVSLNAGATVATWAADLLNVLTGNLGRPGGMLFPRPAVDIAEFGRYVLDDGHGRWRSRVRGLPETVGELPASILAEEIETPGAGQVRALVTIAGNPVLSAPNGRRLARALATLEFMLAIDIYVNETTRHATLILPPASVLAQDHIDILFPHFAVRNVARWSPPVVAKGEDERTDWEILLALTERLGGGPFGIPLVDGAYHAARRLGLHWTPTAIADLLLRFGAHGDRFLPGSSGLSLAKLMAAPHGIDLGPLEPGFTWRLQHPDRRLHLDPPVILGEAARLVARAVPTGDAAPLLLIGRRDLRSNNSWMHNLPGLVSGRERCTLWVHPEDAARAGVQDGAHAALESQVHRDAVLVQVTDAIRPGVVSLPHGWGHAEVAAWQRVAGEHAGVSANDWTDDAAVEGVVGQSILNGVPVTLRPA